MKSAKWIVLAISLLACTSDGSANEAGSNEETVGDGDDGDGDGENACDRLIECAGDAAPELLSSYAKLYGLEGECYEIAGLTKEDCWKECDALREALALVNPEADGCAALGCGDGKLNYGEECDGTSGCSATCRYNTENQCNPVTQFECPGDKFCYFDNMHWGCDDPLFETPKYNLGEACAGNNSCIGEGVLCAGALSPQQCGGATACCVALCYLGATDEAFGSCPEGTVCTPLTEGGQWPPGSELIGGCY